MIENREKVIRLGGGLIKTGYLDDESGEFILHSFDDEPSVIWNVDDIKTWYKDGLRHRDNNLPARISSGGTYKYYKNGKLYDNDAADPACVSQKTDEDYIPPMDENHPMWQKILQMIKDLEENLIQMGIKLGEFTVALPAAIATIAVSLIALVSSVIILPFGSGIPTAITAVQTMIKAIKQLQQKTAEILPLLAVIDTVSLLLPKSAQGVIAQINIIFGLFLIIITGLSAILGLLGGASSAVSKSQTKMASIPLASAPSANPSSVAQGQSVKLSANASGSDYNYTYQWTDANGNVIAKDPAMVDDDGTRTIVPNIPLIVNPLVTTPATTTYTCKVTDGAGTIKTSTVTVTRI